jgi:hypothetical protein
MEELVASWNYPVPVSPGGTHNSSTDYWVIRLLSLNGAGWASLSPDEFVSGQGLTMTANTNIVARKALNREIDLRDNNGGSFPNRLRAVHAQMQKIGSNSSLTLNLPTIGVTYRWVYTS